MSNKPREFWISGIDFETYTIEPNSVVTGFLTCNNPNKSKAMHVIEYSAYEVLKQERDKYFNEGCKLSLETVKLEYEIKELRDECVKKHDANVLLLKEFQNLFKNITPELEAYEELKAKTEKLVASVEFLRDSTSHEMLCQSVFTRDEKDCKCKWKAFKQALAAYRGDAT
jgi:hypothetical protein